MESIEATGKNVDEAVQAAALALGASPEKVKYEVLEEAGGFLGLRSRVKIRAWLEEKPAQPEGAQAAEYQPEAAEPSIIGEEIADPARELMEMLERIVKGMGLELRLELRKADAEEIVVNATGPDASILIGKHGHTLDALQYLAGIAINRKFRSKLRIILDAEGYRDRHRQMLEKRARELAKQVKATGQEAVLDPLPARDRRIIHLCLADDPDITTYSEGEGEDRRLVITPRK